jgi:5-methyltetrahydrofolate--homocysteine methyltransferase
MKKTMWEVIQMSDLSILAKSLIDGKAEEVGKLTQKALDDGVPPDEILNEGLISGMDFVGERFKNGELYIPEVLIAAKAMHAGMDILRPILASSGIEPIGKVAIGTVKGDLHDIGKNLVSMMMEGAGFEICDLGIDVPPEEFVEAVRDGADIIAMSALLTTTMVSMKTTLEALEEAGLRDEVKVMIGGAPVTRDYAALIGADEYARDAASAAIKAKEIMEIAPVSP